MVGDLGLEKNAHNCGCLSLKNISSKIIWNMELAWFFVALILTAL